MNVGIDLLIDSIEPKDVIIFANPDINSPEPHLYVCVGRFNGEIQFVICSTQEESIKKRVVITRQVPETIAAITPANDCPVNRNTWVNCNNVKSFTKERLKQLTSSNFTRVETRLPDRHFQDIINGICLSEIVPEEFQDHLNPPAP